MGAAHASRADARLLLVSTRGSGASAVVESFKLQPMPPVENRGDSKCSSYSTRRLLPGGQLTVTQADAVEPGEDFWTPAQDDDFSAVVLVVDPEQLDGLRKALKRLLSEETIAGLPLLVLVNRACAQDAPVSIPRVSKKLGLDSLWSCRWNIQAFSKANVDGLRAGMDWLLNHKQKQQPLEKAKRSMTRKPTRALEPMLDQVARVRRDRRNTWSGMSSSVSDGSCTTAASSDNGSSGSSPTGSTSADTPTTALQVPRAIASWPAATAAFAV